MSKNIILDNKLKEEYIDQICQIEVENFATPWTRDSFEMELVNDLAHYIIALEDDMVVGYAGFWLVLDECHVTNVAVKKSHQGRKISKMLMKALIDEANLNQADSMTLEVRLSNDIAKNLYESFGFEVEGIRKRYYQDNDEDALIMWKYLKEGLKDE